MGMCRYREWRLRLCGNYGRGGDSAYAEIWMDRRLRMVMGVVRRGERVGVRCWRVKNAAS